MLGSKMMRGVSEAIGFSALVAGTFGCSGAAGPAEHEGTLEIQAGILRDGSTVTRYVLEKADGTRQELEFASAPQLAPNALVRVRGTELSRRSLHVDAVSELKAGTLGVAREPLITHGTRHMAMLLVHWNGPDDTTPAQVNEQLFTGAGSAAALYAEASFGKRTFDGQVFDWLQIPAPTSCDRDTIAKSADAAAAAAGINLSAFDHVGYLVSATSNCNFSAFGIVGVPASPARRTWYNASFPPSLLVHELGHNLGLWHAHSYQCGGAIGKRSQCAFYAEYGDPYDPMASSTTHFDAYAKLAQGWYSGCNSVTAMRDAVFTLAPTESSSTGVQAVRIPLSPDLCPPVFPTEPAGIGGACYYYLEHRQPIGFDGAGQYASAPMHDGILVHTDVDVDLSGNSGLTGSSILDMTPASTNVNGPFWDANLGVGKVFGDPSGVRVRVLSQSGQTVRVAVKVPGGTTAPTCLDGTTAPAPANCNNGVKNSGETDIDCGGANCVPCDDGKTCVANADCWSGSCMGGRCVASCTDGAKNGSETDVDCGGSCTADCAVGQRCNANGDCVGNRCSGQHFCTSGQLSASLNVYSDWQTGFCGSLTLTNNGSTATNDWSALVDFTDSTFTSTDGAVFTAVGNGIQRLTPISPWGNVIYPNSNLIVSFCAAKTGSGYFPEFLYANGRY